MADSIIDEMGHEVIELRKTNVHPNTLRRWAHHLRDVVQPQLAELARLQEANAAQAAAKASRKAVSA